MEPVTAGAVPKRSLPKARVAIVLEGVSDKWQMNVLQVLGCITTVGVVVEGYGTIDTVALVLSQDQARRLATLITELVASDSVRQALR